MKTSKNQRDLSLNPEASGLSSSQFFGIAGRIRLARKARGFSQSALAEATGVSRVAVSNWETGKFVPSEEVPLSEALQVNNRWLYTGLDGSGIDAIDKAANNPLALLERELETSHQATLENHVEKLLMSVWSASTNASKVRIAQTLVDAAIASGMQTDTIEKLHLVMAILAGDVNSSD